MEPGAMRESAKNRGAMEGLGVAEETTTRAPWPRVLLVAYEFPPWGGAGVQRPAKMVKAWTCAGASVAVLTGPAESTHSKDHALLAGLPADLPRFVVGDPSPYLAVQRLRKRLPPGRRFVDRLLVGLSVVIRAVSFPDVSSAWSFGVRFRGLRAVRAFGPDVIVATGPPFSSFLVGAMLARKLKRPLVLDYRDPWTATFLPQRTDRLPRWINPLLEKRVLRQAAGISAAHRAVIRYLRPLLPASRKRWPRRIWVPNGYDPDDFPKRLQPCSGSFVLSYLGTFYLGIRDPSSLFLALEELLDEGRLAPHLFRFRVAGSSQHVKKLYDPLGRLAEVIEIEPYVAHSEAVARLQQATVNLVFEGRTPGGNLHSPGKFYEVLYAQRPVLLVCPEGTTTHLGRRVGGCWICDPEDKDAIKNHVMDLYDAWEAGRESRRPDPQRVRFYDRNHQADRLLRFLGDVSRKAALERAK